MNQGQFQGIGGSYVRGEFGQAAGLEQAEHVAGSRGGELALVGDDVVLGAIASGDVVLGEHPAQQIDGVLRRLAVRNHEPDRPRR